MGGGQVSLALAARSTEEPPTDPGPVSSGVCSAGKGEIRGQVGRGAVHLAWFCW